MSGKNRGAALHLRDVGDCGEGSVRVEKSQLDNALEAFEPQFFNNLVLVLDTLFVHRTRALEKKDGNPLNDVRVLSNSLLQNEGVLLADKTIKLDAAKSVLGYRVGDEIRLNEADFHGLSTAFFSEIESKYL